MGDLQQTHQLPFRQCPTLMSAVPVLVGPGNVGKWVMSQPARAAAPVAETDKGFAVGVAG